MAARLFALPDLSAESAQSAESAPAAVTPDDVEDWDAGYGSGWSAGFAAGVAAQPDASWLVPLPVPWGSVRARDAVRGDDGQTIWTIIRAGWARPIDPPPGTPADTRIWSVVAQCGNERVPFVVDPGLTVGLLVEVAHADALACTIEGLAARMLASRLDPDGGHDGDLDWRGEGP